MPATLSDERVGLVGLEDIQDGGRGGVAVRRTRPKDIESLKTRFFAGDILYGKLRPYLNKVAIAPQSGLCSTEIWAFAPSLLLDSRFAAFFLRSAFFVDRVASLTKGVNLPRLDADTFDSIEIPLPPMREQRQIAIALQEAEEIRRLDAAAEIKLAELIRDMFYEYFVQGKIHDYQPLHEVAAVQAGVALGRKIGGMPVDVHYLRVANVQAGFVDLRDVKTTPATEDEVLQFGLASGDVLLTEGGDFDKLGRGCLWEGQIEPCIHQNHVFRVRPTPGKLNSRFFAHYLQSAKARQYFLRCAKKTTNLASINLSQLKSLPLPRISIEEQERFERQIQVAAECGVPKAKGILNELVRSLSARAFSGQLTADWRKAHEAELAIEARDRDAILKGAGADFPRAPAAKRIPELRTDGIYSDLNREQRDLLLRIQQHASGGDYPRYFSAESLSISLEGPLRRNQQAIEGHLAVLAARGLIVPVSRERQTEDTGEFVFGNAYRLPLGAHEADGREAGASGHARLREMERLAARLKKERTMP